MAQETDTATATLARDPLQDLVNRMERFRSSIASENPGLAQELEYMAQQSRDPERLAMPGYRHEVAYALQDLEKTWVGRIEIAPDLRQEMTRLAVSAPGLQNARMESLMQTTVEVQDRTVLRDIRDAATTIGRTSDQTGPEATSRIDALESRLRLGPHAAEQNEPTERQASTPQPAATAEAAATQAGDRSTTRDTAPRPNEPIQVSYGPSLLGGVLAAFRRPEPADAPPWEAEHTDMTSRFADASRRNAAKAEADVQNKLEASGRAALGSVKALHEDATGHVMGKIQDAAKAEPGGMAAVIAEMREGGRFSDLRAQFNNALQSDSGFAKAYESAESGLKAYGAARVAAPAPVTDPTATAARFLKLDDELGKAGAATPGREDGKSMAEELGKSVAEMLQKAVDNVKAMFQRTPERNASASASPSPGPG